MAQGRQVASPLGDAGKRGLLAIVEVAGVPCAVARATSRMAAHLSGGNSSRCAFAVAAGGPKGELQWQRTLLKNSLNSLAQQRQKGLGSLAV